MDSTGLSVTMVTGGEEEEIVADLIVGADGVNGITSSAVGGDVDVDDDDEGGRRNGNRFLTISCTLPCGEFAADPELETLLNDSTVCGFFLILGGKSD